MNLKLSAWAAIVSVVIIIPGFIIAILKGLHPDDVVAHFLFIVISILELIIFIPIYLGYLKIAKIKKLKFLAVMQSISFVTAILLTILAISTIKLAFLPGLILAISLGIIVIITGVAIFKLKDIFGGIIIAIGVMYIINGVFYISVILTALSPLMGIATLILEAIFFFRASKKFEA